jgi:AraC family ethanolamine operon transcriptional activator
VDHSRDRLAAIVRELTEGVELACDYVDAHVANAPSIQDVCHVAGVSWRTVDYAFRDLFGVTPKQYLQATRLDGVHKELRRKGPATKITDIANDWRFWHMGQFAADYRRQFGELPSETLRSKTSKAPP